VAKKRYIIGEEGCPSCNRLENYLSNNPKDDVHFYKIKFGDPESKVVNDAITMTGLKPEIVPFCVEFNEGKAALCPIEPLLDEMDAYIAQKKPV